MENKLKNNLLNIKFLTLSLIVFFSIFLSSLCINNANADFPHFKHGFVGAKGLVKKSGDNFGTKGNPVWVVYNNKGEIDRWIGEASGSLSGLVSRSGASYLRDVEVANNKGANIVVNKPVTTSTSSVLYDPVSYVILDLSQDKNISYLSAYYISKDMEEGGNLTSLGKNPTNSLGFFKDNIDDNEILLNPLSSVGIESGESRSATSSKGYYKINLPLTYYPICFPKLQNGFLYATLNYSYFNPKGKRAVNRFFTGKNFTYMTGGNRSACSSLFLSSGLGGVGAGIGIGDIINNTNYQNKPVNITVDVNSMSGTGSFVNKAPEGSKHLPFDPQVNKNILFDESKTEFVYSDYTDIPEDAQIIKTRRIDDNTGEYTLWTDIDNDGFKQEDEITTKEFNFETDHRGLLNKISKEDVKNTDIYFFRVSNDQLLGVQQGFKERNTEYYGGGVNSDTNRFGYQFFMRGLGSWTNSEGLKNRKERIRQWQTKAGVDEELIIAENEMRSDYPRAGETIKVVAVNRTSGYTGTAETEYFSGSGITTIIDNIELYPPNLKIEAKRKRITDVGALKGKDFEYLIGFEGSGLTSDEYVIITTKWYDHDGGMLPADLPGLTGRLAISSPDANLSAIKNFEIKPGTHMQLIRLPQESLDTLHYYIHVNGEPPDRNPDFSKLDDGKGPLQYRPAKFVPLLVPVYNKTTDDYDWVYRPEMEFSLFDLDIKNKNKEETDDGHKSEYKVTTINTKLESKNTWEDIIYTLLDSLSPELKRFLFPRELVFGDAENTITVSAVTGKEEVINLSDLSDEEIKKFTKEDYLSLRLYQNLDKKNVLWQYDSIKIKLTMENLHASKCRLLPGETVVIKGETIPENVPLKWEIIETGTAGKVQIISQFEDDCELYAPSNETSSGWVKIRASVDEEKYGNTQEIFTEAVLFVGCPDGCSECEKPGGGFVKLGSVDTRFSMGKTSTGLPAGDIFLRSEKLTKELATPKALFASSISGGLDTYEDENGLRQVVSDQTVADIIVLDEYSYKIDFYKNIKGLIKEKGLYPIDGLKLISSWKIENPDKSSNITKLKITETRDGKSKEYEYFKDKNTLAISKGDGLFIRSKSETIDEDTKDIIETETIKDSSGKISSKTQTTWRNFPWGKEKIKIVKDPDNFALTTTMEYFEDPDFKGNYSRLFQIVNQDGSWQRYFYDEQGRRQKEVSSYLDGNKNSVWSDSRVVIYRYNKVSLEDSELKKDNNKPREVFEYTNGIVTSRTFKVYINTDDGKKVITEKAVNQDADFGDPTNLRSISIYHKSGFGRTSGRLKKRISYDGRTTTYLYEYGTIESDNFIPGDGNAEKQAIIYGTIDSPNGIANKTTKEVSITDGFGNSIKSETYIYTGSGYELISWTKNEFDDLGHLIKTFSSNGQEQEYIWTCCGKESETDSTGTTTNYIYDDLNRITSSIREGLKGDITTEYEFDATGRTLKRTISSNGLSQISKKEYDSAGRLKTSTDPSGLITKYRYENNGLKSIQILPGGAEIITERFIDGRTKKVYGSGTTPQFYSYGVNEDGSIWTKVSTGKENSESWQKTTSDFAGRNYKSEQPGFNKTIVTTNYYNKKGQLYKTETTDSAPVIYIYDNLGNQIRSGLDIDKNDSLDLASNDRITDSKSEFIKEDDSWWQISRQIIYPDENSDKAIITGKSKSRITGLGKDSLTSETISEDINGNITISKAYIYRDRDTSKQIIDYPDSDADQTSISKYGLLIKTTSKTGLITEFDYDSLGRRIKTIDERTGSTIINYNEKHRVSFIKDPKENTTEFSYFSDTGRKKYEKNPLNHFKRYKYNLKGQVTAVWGDGTYPVKYTYDDLGRMKTMTTYRTDNLLNDDSFPDNLTGDTTTWHYDEKTGLLTAKEDAKGNKTTYSYTNKGQLKTRTWARKHNTKPLVTSYIYDEKTDELKTIDYSDSTPDISFKYLRSGLQKEITDASGTRTFTYNESLALKNEITSSYTLTKNYEDDKIKGRNKGFSLNNEYTINYGFDEKGRFKDLEYSSSGKTDKITYNYLEKSNLISSRIFDSGLNTKYQYEEKRNLKTKISHGIEGKNISTYEYTYDEISRRETSLTTGLAFSSNEGFNKYGYNSKNEVTKSDRFKGTDINNILTPIEPEKRLYNYDNIGNRNSATHGTDVTDYETNELNQYKEISSNPLIYDKDGNLVKDSKNRIYTYNCENRLINIQPETPVDGSVKLEFIYDYMGRRISKTKFTYSSGNWSQTEKREFIYDGWNLVKETIDLKEKYYVWGLDLSQSIQGAGGVGGLLAFIDKTDSKAYNYTFDGNGNVGQLVDKENGELSGSYRYDPFGRLISAVGDVAEDNIFRFSTKYFDGDSGLYYYGYRYYSSENGRWINKDPIEETGGINLYGFVNNNSNNVFDINGCVWPLAERRFSSKSEYIIIGEIDHPCIQETTGVLADLIKSLSVNTVNASHDMITLEKFANQYGMQSKFRISIHNNKKYLIVRPSTINNELIKGTRYRFLNPKVAKLAGIASAKISPVSVGLIVLTTVSIDTTEHLLSQETLMDLGVNITVDLTSNAVSTGFGFFITYQLVEKGGIAGTSVSPGYGTAVGIVAGLLVGVTLDIFVTPAIKDIIKKQLNAFYDEVTIAKSKLNKTYFNDAWMLKKDARGFYNYQKIFGIN